MRLNMKNPESIAAWYKVNPKPHGQFLRFALRRWPQFREAIEAARGLI
jgi:hypothetical protein